MIEKMALVASIALPLWNIPLILHIVKRKSSDDINMPWALGVWSCIVLMFPQALISKDMIWKTFAFMNLVMFSGVVIVIFYYRFKKSV